MVLCGFSFGFSWFWFCPLFFLNLAGHALTPCFGGSGSRVGAKGAGGKGEGIFPSRNRVLDIQGESEQRIRFIKVH